MIFQEKKIGYLFLLLIFMACNTESVVLKVQEAEVYSMPTEVQQILVVNRALPQDSLGFPLTFERLAVASALKGLKNGLKESNRFELIWLDQAFFHPNTLEGDPFPEPMDSTTFVDLQKKYQVDALLVLENAQFDIFLKESQTSYNRTDVNGGDYNELNYYLQKSGFSDLVWRFYDAQDGGVIYEYAHSASRISEAVDPYWDLAFQSLLPDPILLEQTSYDAGRAFARHIAPSWQYLRRIYYPKAGGNEEMQKAHQLAQDGKWEEAGMIWKELSKEKKNKLAGRASYNMAVACEAMGKPKIAQSWAVKAFKKHNIQKAKYYAWVLSKR